MASTCGSSAACGQKIHHGLEVVVGMMQQNVAPPDVKENVRLRFRAKQPCSVKSACSADRVDRLGGARGISRTKIERPIDAENVFLLEIENIQQTFNGVLGAILLQLPDGPRRRA